MTISKPGKDIFHITNIKGENYFELHDGDNYAINFTVQDNGGEGRLEFSGHEVKAQVMGGPIAFELEDELIPYRYNDVKHPEYIVKRPAGQLAMRCVEHLFKTKGGIYGIFILYDNKNIIVEFHRGGV